MNGLVATNDDFNGNGKSERSKMDRLKYKFFPLNSHTSACDSCSIEITFCCTKINLYAIFTRPHAPSPSLPPPSYTVPLPVYWESQVGRCYFLLRDVRTFALTLPSVPYPPHSLSLCTHLPTFSVTRLGDLLDFGQLFKAFGDNYFAQISLILRQFL